MKELRDYFRKMNGFDTLSFGLLFLSVCLFALPVFIPVNGLLQYHLTGFLPLGLCIFRVFYPGGGKKSMGNERFEAMLAPIFDGLENRHQMRQQKKIFRFYHCPICSQTLRVPKGKGRVEITCPNCDHKFIRNA